MKGPHINAIYHQQLSFIYLLKSSKYDIIIPAAPRTRYPLPAGGPGTTPQHRAALWLRTRPVVPQHALALAQIMLLKYTLFIMRQNSFTCAKYNKCLPELRNDAASHLQKSSNFLNFWLSGLCYLMYLYSLLAYHLLVTV